MSLDFSEVPSEVVLFTGDKQGYTFERFQTRFDFLEVSSEVGLLRCAKGGWTFERLQAWLYF